MQVLDSLPTFYGTVGRASRTDRQAIRQRCDIESGCTNTSRTARDRWRAWRKLGAFWVRALSPPDFCFWVSANSSDLRCVRRPLQLGWRDAYGTTRGRDGHRFCVRYGGLPAASHGGRRPSLAVCVLTAQVDRHGKMVGLRPLCPAPTPYIAPTPHPTPCASMEIAPYTKKACSRHGDEDSTLRQRAFVFIFAWWTARSRSPRRVAQPPNRTPPRARLAASRPPRLTAALHWG